MTEVVLECNQVMLEISKIMAFVGKFAVAACFSILYTFSAELYPTCVRSSAVGFCSSCARVGGALSPLIFGLDHEYAWFSNTVFGVLSLLGKSTSFLNIILWFSHDYLNFPARNLRYADVSNDERSRK